MDNNPSPLDVAIERVGSASELARRIGITAAAVLQWPQVPPKRVLAVEEVSGVSRHILRPDLYGPPPTETAE
ncbi:MAG: helix-turn-helix domain-containing protein [Rhizobiales bacterium]|nr:helix-turn-helix domain-containing protein [Hyphomicrobiales bacterium]